MRNLRRLFTRGVLRVLWRAPICLLFLVLGCGVSKKAENVPEPHYVSRESVWERVQFLSDLYESKKGDICCFNPTTARKISEVLENTGLSDAPKIGIIVDSTIEHVQRDSTLTLQTAKEVRRFYSLPLGAVFQTGHQTTGSA